MGFGRGLEGTVTAIADGSLTLATADGSTVTVSTDESTAWVVETPIDAAEVAVGAEVSIEVSFGGMPGQGLGDVQAAQVARQVTLTAASAE